ncbi:MAG: class I SAM-dependent methyltransferase [Candidatus Omnitrophota bacterium]
MKSAQASKQSKQDQWRKQWQMLRDEESSLFSEWIYPNTLDDIRSKSVLECGCGGGHHTFLIAQHAKAVTAVDLNTIDIARNRCGSLSNIAFIEDDIAAMNLPGLFDVVIAIGVIHHTDNPDKTFSNLKKHVKPGGKLIVWVYSKEGNLLMQKIVEPARKLLLKKISRTALLLISGFITALLYPVVYSLYRLPVKRMPYYEYFGNFRRFSFQRNLLNVFDKLNAPQVDFISYKQVCSWFNANEFNDIRISLYKGISWRASGVKRN